MKEPRSKFTLILCGVTAAALLFSVPGSLRQALYRGEFYTFTGDFFADLPKRLAGPGKFRFVLQPVIATFLGILAGRADARLDRPAYLFGILFDRKMRLGLLKSGFTDMLNLILMGILVDSICQWLILGASYPGAALLVGPVLIAVPYGLARAISNRCARFRFRGDTPGEPLA